MREIQTKTITEIVKELCIKANLELRTDVMIALEESLNNESHPRAKKILQILLENAQIAREKKLPICQDTGIAIVFVEIGQEVMVVGDALTEAINQGIRLGYEEGFCRKSVVSDPILRENTKDNTPGIIHYNIVPGDKLKITVMPKGFGCENKNCIKMMRPTVSVSEIKKGIIKAVQEAGPDACPPFILGIGLGGTMDKAAQLAKEALILPIAQSSPQTHIARLEQELLVEVNSLNIGPAGLGGKTTALGINILTCPTHIAGLPVAININCHALRSATGYL
ncbi:MAG: fumarate hydratase [bacterium]|nr:fumarate hydratase [bacterium]